MTNASGIHAYGRDPSSEIAPRLPFSSLILDLAPATAFHAPMDATHAGIGRRAIYLDQCQAGRRSEHSAMANSAIKAMLFRGSLTRYFQERQQQKSAPEGAFLVNPGGEGVPTFSIYNDPQNSFKTPILPFLFMALGSK